MPNRPPYPTSYPEVNQAIDRVHAGARSVLGAQFAGMYLHGSLATGDFNPATSDIDFVVMTADVLAEALIPQLAAMHTRIRAGGAYWTAHMEGSYIPRAALRRYDPDNALHPVLHFDGRFSVEHHQSDWVIQRHILREHGVIIAGPDPATLIEPVTPDDLRDGVRGVLTRWWTQHLVDPAFIRDPEYQAFAVLTMCRALHTLAHGTIVTKPAAAQWAQNALGSRWASLIAQARTWPAEPNLDNVSEVQELIRFTLTQLSTSEGNQS